MAVDIIIKNGTVVSQLGVLSISALLLLYCLVISRRLFVLISINAAVSPSVKKLSIPLLPTGWTAPLLVYR